MPVFSMARPLAQRSCGETAVRILESKALHSGRECVCARMPACGLAVGLTEGDWN